MATWLLLLGVFVPLSVSSVLTLADAEPCSSTGPAVEAEVATRSWFPPELVCRYTYPDGTVTETDRHYWAVFVPTVALAGFAAYQTIRWTRARRSAP